MSLPSSARMRYTVIGAADGLLKLSGHLPCQNRGIASQRAYVESGQPHGVAYPILLGLNEIRGVSALTHLLERPRPGIDSLASAPHPFCHRGFHDRENFALGVHPDLRPLEEGRR